MTSRTEKVIIKLANASCRDIYLEKKKRKKNRRISLLDDYYYQSPNSVANQNAGFSIVHWLGDTIMADIVQWLSQQITAFTLAY